MLKVLTVRIMFIGLTSLLILIYVEHAAFHCNHNENNNNHNNKLCEKYDKNKMRVLMGSNGILIGIRFMLLFNCLNLNKDFTKFAELLSSIFETASHRYGEILALHEKTGGIFKFLRKAFKKLFGRLDEEDIKKRSILFLPNAGRPIIEQLHWFHDWIILFLFSIAIITCYTLFIIKKSIFSHRSLVNSQFIEYIWTTAPVIILIAIVLPSLRLLYMADEMGGSCSTVKAIGHQWYWEYDYPDLSSYNSYLIHNEYRLLRTDHRLYFTINNPVDILISSADVLHSWTLPTIGTKADAVPGRVNKITVTPKRPGLYFGQCREICGSNHSFIPVSMECSI